MKEVGNFSTNLECYFMLFFEERLKMVVDLLVRCFFNNFSDLAFYMVYLVRINIKTSNEF